MGQNPSTDLWLILNSSNERRNSRHSVESKKAAMCNKERDELGIEGLWVSIYLIFKNIYILPKIEKVEENIFGELLHKFLSCIKLFILILSYRSIPSWCVIVNTITMYQQDELIFFWEENLSNLNAKFWWIFFFWIGF